MSPPVRQFSFAGGEVAPAMYARTDLGRYESGLRTCRNMIVMRHGGVTGRPGTQYVGTCLNSGNAVRLIPFIFNETGLGQSYAIEFGNQALTFYQNGGNVISSTATITNITQGSPAIVTAIAHGFSNGDIVTISGVIGMTQVDNAYFYVANVTANTFTLQDLYQIAINSTSYTTYVSGGTASKIYRFGTPYSQADLATLQFAESADVITITHPNYPVYELRRLGATNWTLTAVTFGSSVSSPINVVLAGTAGANPLAYYVTAVAASGEESRPRLGSNALLVYPPSVTNPITVSWDPDSDAVYFNVYQVLNGVGGYIGQSTNTSFIDRGTIAADFSHPPPLANNVFASSGNYPSTVGFIQQRRGFAATGNNPLGFWLSKPGFFKNFDTRLGSPDDDPVIGSIAGEEVNAIKFLAELKFMLMLTAGAEIYVQGNGTGVVTPSAINASAQSQYGANYLKPLKVGDTLLFNQALGSFIRDFTFDFAIDGYRGNEITLFSSHLFEGYQLNDWAYQKIPDSLIWAARSDGKLLACTYVREQNMLAWSKHDFTNGSVENVCAIPENGEYALYLSIKRTINGVTKRYIERMSSRIWKDTVNTPAVQQDPINASYLDSFIKYDGRNSTAQTMELIPQITITVGVNDTIKWADNSNGFASTFTGTLASGGVYTSTTLAQAVVNLLNAQSSGYSYSIVGNKFVITNGTWDFELVSTALWTLLGFSDIAIAPVFSITATDSVFSSTSTAYQQNMTLVSSTPYFTSAMVGDQIFFEDSTWISTKGKDGNCVRCTIQAYSSATNVTITPSSKVPVEFQFIAIATWAQAVKTVSGLIYLEGQKVSVWADRFLVASPLNSHVSQTYIVSAGTITLDKPYSVIYVGLPMTQDIESLDLESYFGETMLTKRKRVAKLSAYLYNTRSFFAGSENPDNNSNNVDSNPLYELYEEKAGAGQDSYDEPPPLLNDQDYIILPSRWNKNGRLFIRNVDPVPFSILAISPGEEDPVQGTYKRV